EPLPALLTIFRGLEVLEGPAEDRSALQRAGEREDSSGTLELRRRVVRDDASPEVLTQDFVLRNGHDGFVSVTLVTECLVDVDVVPAPQLLLARVQRLHSGARLEGPE